MVIVRFDNGEEERRALGWLAGRFSFKTWDSGDLMVHEAVLPYLAREALRSEFKGRRPMAFRADDSRFCCRFDLMMSARCRMR